MKTCDKVGCSVTFDPDNDEGILMTEIDGGTIIAEYYCSTPHAATPGI